MKKHSNYKISYLLSLIYTIDASKRLQLPTWLRKFGVISPIKLFDFLPDDLITDIIRNTNAYAKKSIANQLSIDKSYKFYCLVDKGYVWDFHLSSNAIDLDLIP
jgi:hypothetical protein